MAVSAPGSAVSALWHVNHIAKCTPTARISARRTRIVSGQWNEWWSAYLKTGHGYSDELTKLIDAKGINYARQNFRMSLLEYRPMKADDRTIIEREGYWKEALLTRTCFGYNKN